MNLLKMTDVDLKGKRVLIREDFNVPVKEGIITSDRRLQAGIPTLELALSQGATVLVLSHLGRPDEGHYDPRYSLRPIADYLAAEMAHPVRFVRDYLDGIETRPGELIVCENVRFNRGEKTNLPGLAQQLAALCDVFVMDAFGTAHREHASTCGIAQYAPIAVAGPLLIRELDALEHMMNHTKKPMVAIVGGAKVSSKLSLLEKLVQQVDCLIPGGGIANTFLKAQGFEIGLSLYEPDLLEEARKIWHIAEAAGCRIVLPTDVVVGKAFQENCPAYNKTLSHVASDDLIMDIGPDTVNSYLSIIAEAKTILWNGPVGVFEFAQFGFGTRAIALAIADSDAYSIAGGGDTLAAIDQYDLGSQLSYISTGGGAFLTCLEGKPLPVVEILARRAREG
ncbi:MAG: phosphoglycerate kinase [Legionellaceae bacterium]|nr:phosphoglycerate kinase [Legionellaceae bacterium]